MKLEELIYQWFIKDKELAGRLAAFSGEPAVFYQAAPADNQEGWKGGQYPRIVYAVDMQANQGRRSAGAMSVSILCDEAGTLPEELEPAVRECLKDIIITPKGGSPYCFAWSRTDSFEMASKESGADTRIIGMEVRFDVLEYPSQEGTNPDPVAALNHYIKGRLPSVFVLGMDRKEDFLVAGVPVPVFYCRLASVEKESETNMVTWVDGKIAVHVLCRSGEERLKWVMALADSLAGDCKVGMLDGSPMHVRGLVVNSTADYLKEGQLTVTGHYGLPRWRAKKPKLEGIKMTGGFYGGKK